MIHELLHDKDLLDKINPEELPDPLAEENLFREHGRGVFLMRSMMESVVFEKSDSGSDVVMTMLLGQ